MDSTLPVAVPSPYKSRRGWLIAFGIIEILIGCGFLGMIVFSAFAFLGPAADKMASGAMSPRALMAFMSLEYGLLAAVFFAGGIGSIQCKNWARILMLVVSGLWLGVGLIVTLFLAFVIPTIMRQHSGKIPPGTQHAAMVVIFTVMAVLTVLLPAIFLFFYSRQSVKATCLAQNAAQVATAGAGGIAAPGLPVPLAILGVWQALGAISVFAFMFLRVNVLFGVVVHGAAAVLFLLPLSVLGGYAAWAIFQQKLIGWQIALIIGCLGMISTLVTFLRHPDLAQLYREMGSSDQTSRFNEQFPQFLPFIWVGSIVMGTVYLIFVLYTRKYFPTEERRGG
jgi:hypothetical protein